MNIGKRIRMNRLFRSGRLCSIAVDHFFNYDRSMPPGLGNLPATLAAIVAAEPDAVTMQKGTAISCWEPFAGKVPMILQSYLGRIDETIDELIAWPEDALRLGADAFATVAFVRGATEVRHLARAAEVVRQAGAWDMPVVLHVYPRHFRQETQPGAAVPEISHSPEDIAWAVRCAMEVGVDLIKVPYTGDPESYRQIIQTCPIPIVAAGGPKAGTVQEVLEMACAVVKAGAKGMTVGRNVWGFPQVTQIIRALKRVLHDDAAPAEAMREAGL